jgi:hypothetical protein
MGNHILNNLGRLLYHLAFTISQLVINNPLQLLDNPGHKNWQRRRDDIPDQTMYKTSFEIILVRFDHTQPERSNPRQSFGGVYGRERLVHEDLADHGIRYDGDGMVEGFEVKDGSIFFFTAQK